MIIQLFRQSSPRDSIVLYVPGPSSESWDALKQREDDDDGWMSLGRRARAAINFVNEMLSERSDRVGLVGHGDMWSPTHFCGLVSWNLKLGRAFLAINKAKTKAK